MNFKIGICQGRHELPCNLFVFENTIDDPTNVGKLEEEAENFFEANFSNVKPSDSIEIYVTGLTVAVIATIKAATKVFKNVVLKHYDLKTNTYYSQIVK